MSYHTPRRPHPYLNGREVNHVVAGVFGHLEALFPLVERAETLGEHRLADEAVHADHFIVGAARQRRVHHEVAGAARVRVLAADPVSRTASVCEGQAEARQVSDSQHERWAVDTTEAGNRSAILHRPV